jgi:hypothetical protein
MVWPFSKRESKLEIPPKEEHLWSVAQGEFEGEAVIVRYNETAAGFAGHSELPIKLGFAIPLKKPNEGRLPDTKENAELDLIEKLIVRKVTAATYGAYVLALTTAVMKEFVFYIAAGADIAKLHKDICGEVPSHDVQCMADEERKWESFRAFVP